MMWTSKDQALYQMILLGLKSLKSQGWLSMFEVQEILSIMQRGIDRESKTRKEVKEDE